MLQIWPHAAKVKSSTRSALTSFSIIVSLASAVAAREVHVPLRLDHEFLRRTLLEHVYTGPNDTALIWHDAEGCNRLTLSDPRLDSVEQRIRVRSAAAATIGTAVGGECITLVDWSGFVEVLEDVSVGEPELPIVRFRVADSSVYGGGLQRTWTSLLWDWVKQYVHPRLEAVTVDLRQPIDDLKLVLPSFLPHADAERTRSLLDSLRVGGVKVDAPGLEVDVRFDLASATSADASRAPEPTLSVEELVRWQEAWQRWGAFLTFVIKHAARDTLDEEQRRTLLAVLLDARYDLIEALTSEDTRRTDPVRRLFLRAWQDLAPVLRQLGNGLPAGRALQYLGFIAAADALRAIDELEPETGIEVSADGLRRLARIIAPASTEDPLLYDLEVDPELRDLFGFGPPLPPPEPTPEAALDSWLWPAAWAGVDAIGDLVTQLRRWVPKRQDLPRYLPLMRDLLQLTSEETLDSKAINVRFQPLFRWLTLAAAWQESCWRQFIERGGVIRPLTSAAGSVGVMQVNPHVWRGFYDVEALRQNVGYNARAGCEILAHYLNDYAVARGEHEATGSVDNLARATYAVYNGGPSHLRRYRKPATSKSLKRIDAAFWDKYKKVKSGHELAVAECYEP